MSKKTKPTKKPSDGNPFFALRVPKRLLRAFNAHARKCKTTPAELLRSYMASATGVDL